MKTQTLNRDALPEKRPVDLVILSDIHLGTYGCHAEEVHAYMKSIAPKPTRLRATPGAAKPPTGG